MMDPLTKICLSFSLVYHNNTSIYNVHCVYSQNIFLVVTTLSVHFTNLGQKTVCSLIIQALILITVQ